VSVTILSPVTVNGIPVDMCSEPLAQWLDGQPDGFANTLAAIAAEAVDLAEPDEPAGYMFRAVISEAPDEVWFERSELDQPLVAYFRLDR
jgi:hypothetical protein